MPYGHELPDDLAKIPKAFRGLGERINALLKLGRALLALQGKSGIKTTITEGNIVISAEALEKRLEDAEEVLGINGYGHPFQISPVAGAAKITVWPGDVENIIPTIGGTLITDATPPELTVVTGSVYLECTMDAAGTFTAAAIKNAAALPSNTSTLRYRQIGTVSVSGTVVTLTAQTVTTSVSHKLCGGLSTWGQA